MKALGPVGAGGDAGTANLTGVAGGGMQVEDGIGDLDETQVQEPGSKRHKESSVAKDMLMRCAEDAACQATLGCRGTRPTHGGARRCRGRCRG